jgi:hypothetical protein
MSEPEDYSAQILRPERFGAPLRNPGALSGAGGGGGNSGADVWQASVEKRLEDLRTEMRQQL